MRKKARRQRLNEKKGENEMGGGKTKGKERQKNKGITAFFWGKESKAHGLAGVRRDFFGKKPNSPLENGKVFDEKGRSKST